MMPINPKLPQVVILAGGLGSRLGKLTKDTPKPLMPVAGKPYLEYQLRWLRLQGFERILLLTGYLGEQIEECFGDGSSLGLKINYNKEDEPLGTGGALKFAGELLEERFLLIYGDSFLPIDLPKTAMFFNEIEADGLLVVFDNQIADTTVPSNVAVQENAVWVKRYAKETNDPELKYVEAGVLVFKKVIIDLMPNGVCSLETDIFPQLILENSLAVEITKQRFYDIGTPDRLKLFEAVIDNYFPDINPG
jgi:NDP-sugar pyrophosphorylase family protein